MTHLSYRPSPGIGDVIAQSFALLRRRPGLFFGLGAATAAATLLSTVVMLAIAATGWAAFIMAAARQDIARVGELLLAWLGIVLLVSLAAGLIGVLVAGLLVRLAGESLNQKDPTLSDLLRTLGGFVRRMLPLAALGVVAYLVGMGLMLLPLASAMGTLGDPAPDAEAIGLGVLISMLLLVPVSLLAIFVGVRLLYLVQVVSLEELGWLDALRRAWSLTAGAFWRTCGTLIVLYLMVYAVTMVVNLGTQAVSIGALQNLDSTNPLSPEFLGQMLGALAVPMVAQTLLQVVTVPYLQAAITVMYVNRTRELAAPAAGPGYPPAPYGYQAAPHHPNPYGYGPHPPQGYGPAPQGYGPAPQGYGHPQGYGPAPQYPPAWQPPTAPPPGQVPPAGPVQGPPAGPHGQQPPTDRRS